VASLLAAGYTGAELKNLMSNIDYAKFKDKKGLSIPVAGPLSNLIFEKGIYDGQYFEKLLRDLLRKKTSEPLETSSRTNFKDDERYPLQAQSHRL